MKEIFSYVHIIMAFPAKKQPSLFFQGERRDMVTFGLYMYNKERGSSYLIGRLGIPKVVDINR